MLTEIGGLIGGFGQWGGVEAGTVRGVKVRGITEGVMGGRGVTGTAIRAGVATREDRADRMVGVSAWTWDAAALISTAMERIAPRIRAVSA